MSLGTAPLSTAPAAGCLLPFPLDAHISSPLSNVDTLLGMATTLWPIMHRLSNLLSLKQELEKAARTAEEKEAPPPEPNWPIVDVYSPLGKFVSARRPLNAWLLCKPVRKPGSRPRRAMKGVKKEVKRGRRYW